MGSDNSKKLSKEDELELKVSLGDYLNLKKYDLQEILKNKEENKYPSSNLGLILKSENLTSDALELIHRLNNHKDIDIFFPILLPSVTKNTENDDFFKEQTKVIEEIHKSEKMIELQKEIEKVPVFEDGRGTFGVPVDKNKTILSSLEEEKLNLSRSKLNSSSINKNDYLTENPSNNYLTNVDYKKSFLGKENSKDIGLKTQGKSKSPTYKKKYVKGSKKPAVVKIKMDLRDIVTENIIDNFLKKTRLDSSNVNINNYTTKSKSPNPKDTNFKEFVEKCINPNNTSIISNNSKINTSKIFASKNDQKGLKYNTNKNITRVKTGIKEETKTLNKKESLKVNDSKKNLVEKKNDEKNKINNVEPEFKKQSIIKEKLDSKNISLQEESKNLNESKNNDEPYESPNEEIIIKRKKDEEGQPYNYNETSVNDSLSEQNRHYHAENSENHEYLEKQDKNSKIDESITTEKSRKSKTKKKKKKKEMAGVNEDDEDIISNYYKNRNSESIMKDDENMRESKNESQQKIEESLNDGFQNEVKKQKIGENKSKKGKKSKIYYPKKVEDDEFLNN